MQNLTISDQIICILIEVLLTPIMNFIHQKVITIDLPSILITHYDYESFDLVKIHELFYRKTDEIT